MSVELERLAYTYSEFAEAVGLSYQAIRAAVDRGELVPSYYGTKPLVRKKEGERWLESLPAERRAS
jgi:hypothetical protein